MYKENLKKKTTQMKSMEASLNHFQAQVTQRIFIFVVSCAPAQMPERLCGLVSLHADAHMGQGNFELGGGGGG